MDDTSFVLRGVHVLDAGGSFTEPLDVSVRDGTIEAVARGLPTRGGRNLDAAGLWLMPGVIDCHAHVALPSFDALELMRMPHSRRVLETAAALRATLSAGVTLVRDAGGADAGVRDALAAGLVPGPELQVCGHGLGATGGHGDGFLAGLGIEAPVDATIASYPGRPPYLADGPDDVRRAVRLLLRAGADWIKLFATGGVLSGRPGVMAAEFSEAELTVAVGEAALRGRGVMVHALGGPALGAAVRAGARSIEHGIDLTEADAALMARDDCTLVPTLAIYHELAGWARGGRLPAATAQRALEVEGRLGQAVAIAHAAGVPIALGTDLAGREFYGRNLIEIAHLQRAGLSVEEALLAATLGGARLCGVADRLGRMARGQRFDALLLDEAPAGPEFFERPDAVRAVFRAGVAVAPHARFA